MPPQATSSVDCGAPPLERAAGGPALQPARLTVDLLRPALMESVQVKAELVREGGRIRLADATLIQDGKPLTQVRLATRNSAADQERGAEPVHEGGNGGRCHQHCHALG